MLSSRNAAAVLVAACLLLGLPARTSADCQVVQVAAGADFALVVIDDGRVFTWGYNRFGQLGNGTTITTPPYGIALPGRVSDLDDVIAADCGFNHTIALRADGTVWTWGRNVDGQLGNGTQVDSSVPVHVTGIQDVVAVAAGGEHSLALRDDGTVWAWGANDHGQLGDGTNTPSNTPVQVAGLTDVTGISVGAGGEHSLVKRPNLTLWAWGHGTSGQLGNGVSADSNVPVQVTGLGMVSAFAAGRNHSLAILFDQSIWVWGLNDNATINRPPGTHHSNIPIRVETETPPPLFGLTLSGGNSYSLVVSTDRTVWGWGESQDGRLGNGTTPDYIVYPVQAVGLTGAQQVAAGSRNSYALTTSGALWSWGNGQYGQIGNGLFDRSIVPVAVDLSPLDAIPPDQGNVFRAVKQGDDVLLSFTGAPATKWRLYCNPDKFTLGQDEMAPDATQESFLHADALLPIEDNYYRVKGLSPCSLTPGP